VSENPGTFRRASAWRSRWRSQQLGTGTETKARPGVSLGGEERVGGVQHCPFRQKILIFASGLDTGRVLPVCLTGHGPPRCAWQSYRRFRPVLRVPPGVARRAGGVALAGFGELVVI
jgi:hypothetical protein